MVKKKAEKKREEKRREEAQTYRNSVSKMLSYKKKK